MDNLQLVLNGLGAGQSLDALIESGGELGVLRPWAETDSFGKRTGRSFITINTGEYKEVQNPATGVVVRVPVERNVDVTNATTALLKREDWLRIDQEVSWAAKPRLRVYGDIFNKSPYVVPNGMAVLAIQHTIAKGDASATISMDPAREGERSRPTLDIGLTPMPVIHGDGSFTMRDIAISRQSNIPLDITNIQLTARKIAEIVEKLSIGNYSANAFNGMSLYGLTNHPSRIAGVMTIPTANGWVPKTTITELLVMIKQLEDAFYWGPYTLYHSNGWGPYLDGDYSANYAGETLRTRLGKISKITEVKNIDFLGDYQMILLQNTRDVIEAVQGTPFTTVQWTERGGMENAFKVMCQMYTRVRADANGNLGINHATAA